MIWNVIDHRKSPYRWKRINAIIEATSHDNGVRDSDEVPPRDDDVVCDQRVGISLSEAIHWANSQSQPVTLFLYDQGQGV
jgi:hypothetical protein